VPAGTRKIKEDKIDSHSPVRSRTGFMGMADTWKGTIHCAPTTQLQPINPKLL